MRPPSSRRLLTACALLAVALRVRPAVAGEAGPLSRSERRLSFPDHEKKTPLATELIQGTIVQVDWTSSEPRILVEGKPGLRQWVSTYPRTYATTLNGLTPAYRAKSKERPFYDIAPNQDFFDSGDGDRLDEQVSDILRAAAPGGGYVQGILVRRLRGDWVATWLEVELTGPQEQAMTQAFLDSKAKKEAAEKAARDQAESDRKAKAESDWRAKAAACRAVGKPRLTGEARKNRVLAEDAVHEKRFDDAAGYYARALEIEPCWAEGHFNLALLDGELKAYAQAAEHMHRYLDLAPGAKDAEQAQDKIIVWEEKAKPGSK